MGQPNRGPKTALLFLAISAMSAAARAAGTSGPCPHWREDLEVSCRTFGAQASLDEERLSGTAPELFLPPKAAEYVRRCEYARQQQNQFSLERLHTEANPLKGLIRHLDFIPDGILKAADLPPSGARLVFDCRGKHLQLKGAFRTDKLRFAFIKKSFTELLAAAPLLRALDSLGGWFHPEAGTRVTAASCPLEELKRGPKPRLEVSTWTISQTGSLEIASLPQAFVSPECFRAGRQRAETAPGDDSRFKLATNSTEYAQALAELADEERFTHDYCAELSRTDPRYKANPGLCEMENRDRKLALTKSFQGRLSPKAAMDYELKSAENAADPAEQKLHEARALLLDRYLRYDPSKPTPANMLLTFDELRSWCSANICACRVSGAGLILANGVVFAKEREQPFSREDLGSLLSNKPDDPAGCALGFDIYATGGLMLTPSWAKTWGLHTALPSNIF